MENVILVNELDEAIGEMEKLEAHQKALLHRAFSVFIFNDAGELLLQRRAIDKYHCGGMWTNTCCSHQRVGESDLAAAERRLMEEMGIKTNLEEKFSFIYKADVGNGLTEHEFDHVFIGKYNQDPNINPDEVADFHWISLNELKYELIIFPNKYTPWFKIIFKEYLDKLGIKN